MSPVSINDFFGLFGWPKTSISWWSCSLYLGSMSVDGLAKNRTCRPFLLWLRSAMWPWSLAHLARRCMRMSVVDVLRLRSTSSTVRTAESNMSVRGSCMYRPQ